MDGNYRIAYASGQVLAQVRADAVQGFASRRILAWPFVHFDAPCGDSMGARIAFDHFHIERPA